MTIDQYCGDRVGEVLGQTHLFDFRVHQDLTAFKRCFARMDSERGHESSILEEGSTGPDTAVSLAGFVLAHAVWSVSDLLEGEFLVPLAMTEKAGQRELHRFAAETLEGSIANGKSAMGESSGRVNAWAFASEGQFNEGGGYVNVISVEAWAKGMTASISFVQKFRLFASGKFGLLGDHWFGIDGKFQNPSTSSDLLPKLNRAIQSHPKAAEHWPEWFVKTS